MNNLLQACFVEFLKARRSRLPLGTALAFSLAPFAGGFFMIVIRDPELARRLGMISAKAQIVAGAADWPTYLGVLAQAVAIGGIFLYSFIASWVFGREFSDHTIKDLLALPTPRASLVLAKFLLIFVWSALLTVFILLLSLGVGAAVGLPPAPAGVILQSLGVLAGAAGLTIALAAPIAFFASAGGGYLPPISAAILLVISAQIVAAAGWGDYFPWSVPALYSGMAGPDYGALGPVSYILVVIASLLGMLATFAWWQYADQTR
jgi:ABC-2 type transport system permease protein